MVGDNVAVLIGGGLVVMFDAVTVSSSAKSREYWVGSEVNVVAETKLLHLFAFNFNSAPHRQAIRWVGKIVLCIPLVEGSYPAAMNCWAFSRVNAVWWFAFLNGHVIDVCPSSTSNPHEKQMFQLLWRLYMLE